MGGHWERNNSLGDVYSTTLRQFPRVLDDECAIHSFHDRNFTHFSFAGLYGLFRHYHSDFSPYETVRRRQTAINSARSSVAIRWMTHGKPVKSIHSVHVAHVSTMMSDRRIAWFQIGSEELHSLITQHQLVITNGVNFHGILRRDFLIGGTSIPDRIPSFRESICYVRLGSDDFQHPFSVYVLTNPSHNEAVWYTTYDR